MKVLFIGGTGVISSACADITLADGIEYCTYSIGESRQAAHTGGRSRFPRRHPRTGADADRAGRSHLGAAVVDWVAFTPEHIAADIELFPHGRTAQYVFIGLGHGLRKPPRRLPITESTPRSNPFWPYATNKIACEERLEQAHRSEQFPVTIVRPRTPTTAPSCPRSATTPPIARLPPRASRPWSMATGTPSGC